MRRARSSGRGAITNLVTPGIACLTDSDGPYIELMAGVYTDNQPDFSFLAPWETKTFTQYWYPIREIGPACAANLDAAASVRMVDGVAQVGVCVTRQIRNAQVTLECEGAQVGEWTTDLSVSTAFLATTEVGRIVGNTKLGLRIEADGREILRYDPPAEKDASEPQVATEPAAPEEIVSNDELYLTGLHLEQYRHATRQPELYWQEALRRDAGDARCNNAMGLWRLKRGEFAEAERHFRAAIARLTRRNPNPIDGEPYYNLGLTLRFEGRDNEAYDTFAKAAWNGAWVGAAHHAMAEIDSSRIMWKAALEHVELTLGANAANLNARNLRAMILRKLGREAEAAKALRETQSLDPLDVWSRYLISGEVPTDNRRLLDLVFDLSRAGFTSEALEALRRADWSAHDGSMPMIFYAMADLLARAGDEKGSAEAYRRAAETAPDYCFPSRLEDLLLFEKAIAANPKDARAAYYVGNWLYDRRRHEEAIVAWERATAIDPDFPTAWRNLGIAYYNVKRDAAKARDAFERAFVANRDDARVFYERDQLWKRTGETPERRLAELQSRRGLCDQRDDLTVELATLLNQTGKLQGALEILLARKFQPWEGGEGLVLAQFTRANLLLGHSALAGGDAVSARNYFEAILRPPQSLGEAKHLLANQSDVFFWIGASYARLGQRGRAEEWWARATHQRGDFREMSVRTISEMSFWSAMASRCLGSGDAAAKLLQAILDYSVELESTKPKIDYFATSLPAMLLFEEDLERRNKVEALYLRGQALLGIGKSDDAKRALGDVLILDRNYVGASDLLKYSELVRQVAELAE